MYTIFDDRERYTLIIIYFLMTVFGGIGNIISIICVQKQMKFELEIKNSHKILMSLIISDTIVVLFFCPVRGVRLLYNIPDSIYEVAAFVYMMSCCASSFSIVLLSLERYVKLTKFHMYHLILTTRRIHVAIIMCWVIPILMATTRFFPTSVDGIFYSLTVLGTLIALVVFYILIYRYTWKSQRKIKKMKTEFKIQPDAQGSTKDSTSSPLLKKLTRKVLLLIASYFVCSFPVLPVGIIYWLGLLTNTLLFNVTVVLYLGNSCINPVIYVICDTTFRKRAKGLFIRTQRRLSLKSLSMSSVRK